jgi:uncharacterized damage-inducible protein DinB
MSLESEFLKYSADKLGQLCGRVEDCVAKLTHEQVWARGAESENAVGNLLLHLAGNVRQWILSGVGGAPDLRERDREFAARDNVDPAELTVRLRSTVDAAAEVIRSVPAARLTERIVVQSYDVSVLEAIYHVVEHFSGHVGQIIFATKLLTGEDLGFYRHLATTKAHSEQTP